MPRTLKRRSDAISRDASEEPAETPEPPRRRQRSGSDSSPAPSIASSAEEDTDRSQAATQIATLIKKLVRLALATEYSRAPLRRADISTKIFKDAKDTASSRSFKMVFAGAQKVLQATFGMELIELPAREKTSLKDRRAQTTQTKATNTSSKSWILISRLPKEYKTNPAIIQPTHAPSVEAEAGYTAIYTFVLALIYLNSNSLSDQKLERYLSRMNAETYTPFGTVDKLLKRMTHEGYIEKRKDTSSGEEVVEWGIGPRGKLEVGIKGVVGLVKSVYGFGAVGANAGGTVKEEVGSLEARLSRSLGIKVGEPRQEWMDEQNGDGQEDGAAEEDDRQQQQQQAAARQEPRRSGRRRVARDDDDDDEDEDEEDG